jgi:F-type H+-transporting ATPase subunit alpha
VPLDKVQEFEHLFLERMENKLPDVLEEFRKGKLEDASLAKVRELAADLAAGYRKN